MPEPLPPDAPVVADIETPQQRRAVNSHILFTIGVLLALFLAWHLLKELEILYVSALFAVVLTPIVGHIQRLRIRTWHPSRAVAIIILFLIVAGAAVLFFALALPPVMRDLRNFIADVPGRIPLIVTKLKHLPLASKVNIDAAAVHVQATLANTAEYLFTSLPHWLSHLFDILTATFLTIYFMLEGDEVFTFFLALFRAKPRLRLKRTLETAEHKMSKWLLGQSLLMLILGVASTVVFGFLHVRYFVLLGVLMGLLNLIPIAGGIITICLAGGVAAIDSWTKMAGVFIFYAIYINLENAVLTPRIMKSSVDLMGITVLVALLIGTALAGIVGALVAVPTAALISVLLKEYAVQRDARITGEEHIG